MYAIIQTGGKQVRVEVGDRIFVEKLPAEAGKDVTIDNVLLLGGEKLVIGNPFVKGASVTCKVEKQGLERKIIGYKYKPKKNERRRYGHRQPYTALIVKSINVK